MKVWQTNGQNCACQDLHNHQVVLYKGKVLPYSLLSARAGADPGVGDFIKLSFCGRLPLLSAKPVVTFSAEERHRPSTSIKLYCLVTEAHRCEQLAQGCCISLSQRQSNPRPIDCKSNTLSLVHCIKWYRVLANYMCNRSHNYIKPNTLWSSLAILIELIILFWTVNGDELKCSVLSTRHAHRDFWVQNYLPWIGIVYGLSILVILIIINCGFHCMYNLPILNTTWWLCKSWQSKFCPFVPQTSSYLWK